MFSSKINWIKNHLTPNNWITLMFSACFIIIPILVSKHGPLRKIILITIGILLLFSVVFTKSSLYPSFKKSSLKEKVFFTIMGSVLTFLIVFIIIEFFAISATFITAYLLVGAIQSKGDNEIAFITFTELSSMIILAKSCINSVFSYIQFKKSVNLCSLKDVINNFLTLFFSYYVYLMCNRIQSTTGIFDKNRELTTNAFQKSIGHPIPTLDISIPALRLGLDAIIMVFIIIIASESFYRIIQKGEENNN